MASFIILALPNNGLYNINSIYELKSENQINWYRVDTTGVDPDSALADGIYSDLDTCCYFYSDTVLVYNKYLLDSGDYSVWSPIDADTFIPSNPNNIVYPAGASLNYQYNFIKLNSQVADFGANYIIDYNYGLYSVSYKKTDQYFEYLELLNNFVSSGQTEN